MDSNLTHYVEHRKDFWLPTWQEVIDNLNECRSQESEPVFHTDTMGVIVHEVRHENYLQVQEFAAILSSEYNNAPVSAHTYISFTDKAKTFGKHVDDLDVYFLQAIGQTQFTVWENDKEYVHTLSSGDMLHIPAGLYHDTIPLTPRVGISYGVEV